VHQGYSSYSKYKNCPFKKYFSSKNKYDWPYINPILW